VLIIEYCGNAPYIDIQGVQSKFGKKCGNVGRALEMWDFLQKCRNFRKNVGKLCFLWPARARKKFFKSAITKPSAQGKNKNKGAKP
jgi:hypothetical protein